jgi:hypothetical protein
MRDEMAEDAVRIAGVIRSDREAEGGVARHLQGGFQTPFHRFNRYPRIRISRSLGLDSGKAAERRNGMSAPLQVPDQAGEYPDMHAVAIGGRHDQPACPGMAASAMFLARAATAPFPPIC